MVNPVLVTVLEGTGSHPGGLGQPHVQLLAEQGPAWAGGTALPPGLGAALNSHAGLVTADKPGGSSDCFIAAFGTPAVCCHDYLLHLEGLIVLLNGSRNLDTSF